MMQNPIIPPEYAERVIQMRGAAGEKWLQNLPTLIETYVKKWSITVELPFPQLSFNYAAPAIRGNGTKAVLKVGFPSDKEFKTEIEALKVFDGRGMVRLLESDSDQSIILLERIDPGTPLTKLHNYEEATRIAAQVMKKIWQPALSDHLFPTVVDWGKGFARMRKRFAGKSGPIPYALADKAEELFDELVKSQKKQVLLHGDLHHENILQSVREGWLAIDPKGVVGEPAYETGAFLRNPSSIATNSDAKQIMIKRIGILSEELGLDRERILNWAQAQAVLSTWWVIEDNSGGLEQAVTYAEMIHSISEKDL